MKIYTRTGDKGNTQVYADTVEQMPKSHRLLSVYGTLDELNAYLGLVGSMLEDESLVEPLHQAQQTLFQIGFTLSASSKISHDDVSQLEQTIDQWQAELPPQTSFILPGGHPVAAQLHVARTVCRRAEREVVGLQTERDVCPHALTYLNRLSDWLFTLARWVNHQQGVSEPKVQG